MPLKTLFLNPPSFENFDGGAGSRWPATREIESYWYPVWLAYPAGMLEGARLLDAPPHHISGEETIQIAKDHRVISTGPYALVRHPQYAAAFLYLFGMPLALGSYWGLLVFVAMMAAVMWRLFDEETLLAARLPGYAEYQRQVRWRLLPGIF